MVARYIVSAHAMNNGGPTALIIDRGDWTADMDFVGHKKVGGVKLPPQTGVHMLALFTV